MNRTTKVIRVPILLAPLFQKVVKAYNESGEQAAKNHLEKVSRQLVDIDVEAA